MRNVAAVTTVPYRIRRSNRALHARILVDADGVEVVVPRRFPLRNVEPFVQEKRPWIERTLRRLRESEADFPPAWACDGGEIPYLGERLSLPPRFEPLRGELEQKLTPLPDPRAAAQAARRS